MKSKILKAAKALLRLRCRNAGDWKFYKNPAHCLYGPHGGVSFWGGDYELREVCEMFAEPYVRYSETGFAGLVIKKAKQLATRYTKFRAHLENWQPVPGTRRCYSDAVEQDFVNAFGRVETRQVECIPCLP